MSADVKAARGALENKIIAALDEAKKCRMPGECLCCAKAVADAMKLADLYAYAAIEANEQSGAAS